MKTTSPRGVLASTEIVGLDRDVTPRGGGIKTLFGSGLALGLIVLLLASSCKSLDFSLPPLGKAGKYRTGKLNLQKPGGTGVRYAVSLLESIAVEDPVYRDTLTLLGRAYYQQRQYQLAQQILERALKVNKEDEIAWLVLGLTQLRLGDDQRGLESFKGGLSLLYKASKPGYRGYEFWDRNNMVRTAIRRAIFQVQKGGLENKERLIRSGELIVYRIDDEEYYQAGDKMVEKARDDFSE